MTAIRRGNSGGQEATHASCECKEESVKAMCCRELNGTLRLDYTDVLAVGVVCPAYMGEEIFVAYDLVGSFAEVDFVNNVLKQAT